MEYMARPNGKKAPNLNQPNNIEWNLKFGAKHWTLLGGAESVIEEEIKDVFWILMFSDIKLWLCEIC